MVGLAARHTGTGALIQSKYSLYLMFKIVGPNIRHRNQKQDHSATQTFTTNLRQVSIFHMDSGHTVKPGLAQLRCAGIRLCETVLQVHQHLWISLMLLHLRCGHQHCSDAFSQVFHIRWESCVLLKMTH